MTDGRANHLLSAASPTFVKARILNEDGQVIRAAVVAQLCAGRAATDIIPAHFSYFADMIQNPELRSSYPAPPLHSRVGLQSSLTPRDRHFFAADESLQFTFGQFAQTVEVSHLRFQRVIGPIEPETAACPSMNPQRATNCIAK